MKKLFGAVLATAAVLFASVAHADIGADMRNKFDKLTPEQQAAMYQQVVQQAAATKEQKEAVVTPEKVTQYADIGATIGKSLAGAAKELGVVANDFMKTPAGVFATVLITWKIIGKDLVHVVGGGAFFMFFLIFWFWSFKRSMRKNTAIQEYEENGKMVRKIIHNDTGDVHGGYWILFLIGTAITAVMVFTM